MGALLLASLIWSFSFGLIQEELADLPPAQVAMWRLIVAFGVFLPFLRLRPGWLALRLAAIGGLQYGLMYLCYQASYRFLLSHEIALFTVFTPLWVRFLAGLGRPLPGDLSARQWGSVVLAVVGAGLILGLDQARPGLWQGFLLVQAANFCFAAGQVIYRRIHSDLAAPAASRFAWLYLGGAFVAALGAAWSTVGGAGAIATPRAEWRLPQPREWAALAYLGVIASGLGFFLWNEGSRRVRAGSLAVANNLKVPMAALVSLIIFDRELPSLPLWIGTALVAMAILGEAGFRIRVRH